MRQPGSDAALVQELEALRDRLAAARDDYEHDLAESERRAEEIRRIRGDLERLTGLQEDVAAHLQRLHRTAP